jgi:hypothetical protein
MDSEVSFADFIFSRTAGRSRDLEAQQGGLCAICQEPFDGTPNIDDCRTTGRVRSLLCGPCNRGLGCFKDSTTALLNAFP